MQLGPGHPEETWGQYFSFRLSFKNISFHAAAVATGQVSSLLPGRGIILLSSVLLAPRAALLWRSPPAPACPLPPEEKASGQQCPCHQHSAPRGKRGAFALPPPAWVWTQPRLGPLRWWVVGVAARLVATFLLLMEEAEGAGRKDG